MGVIIGILKTIILLGFLIFIHESGHFIVAKLCKVKVKEFSIGFGPKLYSNNSKETVYSVRAIPLGGYVNMLDIDEAPEDQKSFGNAKLRYRIAIVVAGAIINIILGLLVYFCLMTFYGFNASTIVENILPEFVEQQNVLQSGDKILKINNKKTRVKQDVDNIVASSIGEELDVELERNGEILNLKVPKVKIEISSEFEKYILGVEIKREEKNFKNNLYYGYWETIGFFKSMIDSLKMLVSRKS